LYGVDNLTGTVLRIDPSTAGATPVGASGLGDVSGLEAKSPAVARIASDDFNRHNLALGRWTFVDPRGDSHVRMGGAGTSNARVDASVPGRQAHTLWISGTTLAPLLQPAPEEDFTVEAKFVSPLTLRVQQQGIVVEESPPDFLRFELYYDGSKVRV